MFFSGDPTTRKRVDLGGRSSKERDRQKLIEQTRLERNRRLWLRQQNAAAIKIQVRFRSNAFVYKLDCGYSFCLLVIVIDRSFCCPVKRIFMVWSWKLGD